MRGDIRVVPLYSSSEGNSTLVTVNGHHILIDCGKNCKQCGLALQKAGVYPDDIEAVFLTHAHSDHISGIAVFMKKYLTPVYGTKHTLFKIGTDYTDLLHEIDEKSVTVFDEFGFRVLSYPTHHDVTGSVIYRIENTKSGASVCVMTDLGYVTEGMLEFCGGCDGGLFESNYDPHMLETGPYDYYLKKRIKGNGGHISNEECAQLLEYLLAGGTTKFILGHISPINNTPSIARGTVTGYLESKGYVDGVDYELQTAPKSEPGRGIEI
ncbi:Phosphoribosyl 1,2-cyclic phosphodiesterase [Ruminococcaceae bacterium YRB3002]|nr:Phosphoribosyl 1,2-cyclic phosphodiesterase [Ruminococcaceae bacterium YRB3002]